MRGVFSFTSTDRKTYVLFCCRERGNCRGRGDKSLMEEFFNSLEEIVQKSDFKGVRT